MQNIKKIINKSIKNAHSRIEIWTEFLQAIKAESVLELGVARGIFAKAILSSNDLIKKYIMIDPWRNLEDWNKPANKSNENFNMFYDEMKKNTDFAKSKLHILRGKTTEVIGEIRDESLDFSYIDGDHTLKGITIDLINIYPKIKTNGWIGGDDFSQTIWQHEANFEPTLVFPFAIYFAEAMAATIYCLPHSQFLIHKTNKFKIYDYTGAYKDTSLLNQLKS
jgi:hypothetical protein